MDIKRFRSHRCPQKSKSALRARRYAARCFLHARDPEGLRYPDHTLPLSVLKELPL